jgi:hypothetical protein
VGPVDGIRGDLPTLKEAFVKLTMGLRPLTTWVFVANITDEFVMGFDVMHGHDASVDLNAPPAATG